LSGVTMISGGFAHSLAVKADGTFWMWGDNSNGQLGDGTTTGYSLLPLQVTGITGLKAVSVGAGYYHNLLFPDNSPVATPSAPSNLFALALSATENSLQWTDNSTNEDAFRIERKIGTNGTYAVIAFTVADETFYLDSNVIPGTTYVYRTCAVNSGGVSAYSNEAIGVMHTAPSLTASFVNGTDFVIQWTGAAGAEYQTQTSTNLINWSDLGQSLSGNGTLSVSDNLDEPRKFYRVIVR
jgi:hypothetical protein